MVESVTPIVNLLQTFSVIKMKKNCLEVVVVQESSEKRSETMSSSLVFLLLLVLLLLLRVQMSTKISDDIPICDVITPF